MRMRKRMTKFVLAGALALWPRPGSTQTTQTQQPAQAAPQALPKPPPAKKIMGPPPIDDPKALAELAQEVERFDFASKDYRATVNHIVKREYLERRRQVAATFEAQAQNEEKAERERRVQAITMHEQFLAKYPNDDRWTPDVIFRLAELYFEKSEDEFLNASEEYDKAIKAGSQQLPPQPQKNYQKTIE